MDKNEVMDSVTRQFLDAIRKEGMVPPEKVEIDGRMHHFNSTGRTGDKKGWYVLNPGRIPNGSFGDFRTGRKVKGWRVDIGRPLTVTEEREFADEQKNNQSAKAAKTAQGHRNASRLAARILEVTIPARDDHDYLVRKNVKAPNGIMLLDEATASIEYSKKNKPFLQIRSKDGKIEFGLGVEDDLKTKSAEEICQAWKSSLVIPMYDENGFQSVQFISKAGDKKFLYGAKKQGCYSVIGDIENAEVILQAEGFATAEEIHEATGYPVVIAYDAGNMPIVAPLIRAQYPDALIVICADDDWQTKDNPGLTKGLKAATAVDGVMAVPVINSENRSKKATDFNDMAALHGKAAVFEFFENFFKKQSLERSNSMTNVDTEDQAAIIARPANSNMAPAPVEKVADTMITTGTIVRFGTAPYQHDPDNKPTFYIDIRNGEKTKTLWGVDLERALGQSGLGKGDDIAAYNRGRVRTQTMVKVFDTEGKFLREEPRTVTKNLWHIGPYEEYLDQREERDYAPPAQPRYAEDHYTVEEQTPHATRSEPQTYIQTPEPTTNFKTHFSKDDFTTIQKIWKGVPHRTAYHTESGYHLVVDEVRKVIVSKDRIELARKARHRTDQSYASACEHARQFWGGQMEVQGDNQHRVKAWAYANVYGVEVTNFMPNDRERLEAEKIMAGLRKDMEPAFSRPSSRPQGGKPGPRPGA